MFNLDFKKLNIDENMFKAYVNQQVSEIANVLGQSLEVMINCEKIEKSYKTVFTIQHKFGELKSEATDKSIFDSIKKAANGMISGVVDIEDAINPQIREQKIIAITNKNYLLH